MNTWEQIRICGNRLESVGTDCNLREQMTNVRYSKFISQKEAS